MRLLAAAIGFAIAVLIAPYLQWRASAHELARGERPYADIVPVHGLLSDGAIDWLVMESGGDLHDILQTRLVVSCLNLLAIFAVAFAATGSAELALLAAMLSVMLIPSATI